jgi:hypothetical protein
MAGCGLLVFNLHPLGYIHQLPGRPRCTYAPGKLTDSDGGDVRGGVLQYTRLYTHQENRHVWGRGGGPLLYVHSRKVLFKFFLY